MKQNKGGRPPMAATQRKQKTVVSFGPAEYAELKRRQEATGATVAEMTRRAVKFWLNATRAVAYEEPYRKVTGKGEGK